MLEQINIILSKINFEKKSKVSITDYILDINSRIISKKDLSLKLTEREVELLIYLNDSKHENSSEDLQKNVWKHSQDLETHTVETHIYRLRKKIKEKFQDDNFIKSTKNGYEIN